MHGLLAAVNAPHPLPLPACGEREGRAEREGEGRQAMDVEAR